MMNVVRLDKRIEELKEKRRGDDWSGLDVYFLGFDSLSQMSFRYNYTFIDFENLANSALE